MTLSAHTPLGTRAQKDKEEVCELLFEFTDSVKCEDSFLVFTNVMEEFFTEAMKASEAPYMKVVTVQARADFWRMVGIGLMIKKPPFQIATTAVQAVIEVFEMAEKAE